MTETGSFDNEFRFVLTYLSGVITGHSSVPSPPSSPFNGTYLPLTPLPVFVFAQNHLLFPLHAFLFLALVFPTSVHQLPTSDQDLFWGRPIEPTFQLTNQPASWPLTWASFLLLWPQTVSSYGWSFSLPALVHTAPSHSPHSIPQPASTHTQRGYWRSPV